jgi:hypothetical protein
LPISVADHLHRRTVGTERVGDEDICATMAFHRFPREFLGCLAITALCDEDFQDFPIVIHCPPKVVRLTIDLREHLVHVPSPIRICAHLADPFIADPSGKLQAKSVPPKSNFLVADLDATLVQNILDIPKRKRKPNIHHHGQTDDLRARLEVAKRAAFCHPQRLSAHPARLNRFCCGSAPQTLIAAHTAVHMAPADRVSAPKETRGVASRGVELFAFRVTLLIRI